MAYTVLDAAIDSVENYIKAFDTEQNNIEMSLQPYFNIDGETTKIHYKLNLKDEGLLLEQDFEMEQSFQDLDALIDHDYAKWVEEFVEKFPNATLHYRPTPIKDSVIDESLDSIYQFKQAFGLKNEDLKIVVDLERNKQAGTWFIEYHVRTVLKHEDGSNDNRLDMRKHLDEFEKERVLGEIYPLWIQRFTEDLPEAQIQFMSPDEID